MPFDVGVDGMTEGVNAGASRPCRTKKERQPWRSFLGLPQKSRSEFCGIILGFPQKSRSEFCGIILGLPQKSRSEFCGIISGLPQKSRSEFCGKRRRRRKRKQLEQTQAVSKCALRRRGGDNRTPPKPLKGSPRRSFGFYLFLADASLLRSFEALLSFA